MAENPKQLSLGFDIFCLSKETLSEAERLACLKNLQWNLVEDGSLDQYPSLEIEATAMLNNWQKVRKLQRTYQPNTLQVSLLFVVPRIRRKVFRYFQPKHIFFLHINCQISWILVFLRK